MRKGRKVGLQLRRIERTKYLISVRNPVQSSKLPHGSWQRHCMTRFFFFFFLTAQKVQATKLFDKKVRE